MNDINKELYPIQRFKIMGYLKQVERANYSSISDFTELSYPEISKTVKFLEERGYVNARKIRSGRYPETVVEISREGSQQFADLLRALRKFSREDS